MDGNYPSIDGLAFSRTDFRASMSEFSRNVENGSPTSATLIQEMLNQGFERVDSNTDQAEIRSEGREYKCRCVQHRKRHWIAGQVL